MRRHTEETDVLEFSTEVVRETGSPTNAMIYAILAESVGKAVTPIDMGYLSNVLGVGNPRAMTHVRKILTQLDEKGLIKFTRGDNRWKKPTVRILKRYENDTDVNLKWRDYIGRFSSRHMWVLTHLQYYGEPIHSRTLYELCEGTLTEMSLSGVIQKLKNNGLIEKANPNEKNCKKIHWKLKDKYVEVA
ncbi:hypothetical protein COE80_19380 [Bacillus pseudomycoides]|uniref:hypothetical protein n=1 Tax=Bacillus pseudomycoides TaxID=64104 RepID=UPI000BFC4BAA|nr:hypothetical protein [Bacillus pseudomycoides]PHB23076.1 hypothetical protein COE80_19380 [Bacillus pseudomycoides]PHE37605.1 hypothetical protein COF51_16345 [Bacillus pseudomycoides]